MKTRGPNLANLGLTPVREAVESIAPGGFDRLPFTCRVLAENLVRRAPPRERSQYLALIAARRNDRDFPFHPARVVLQDLLGTPVLVDLAGLREAVAAAGGDPAAVNSVVPAHLIVDHSVNVEADGAAPGALERNMAVEARRNAERFEFLAWARRAFGNVAIVMPGNGILHQINLERLSPVIQTDDSSAGLAFPDTLVGTDSHTTMINALGVLGWGVGGIEAESVMLGRPIWMRLPPLVGVELRGTRPAGVQATDVVLALTQFLRGQSVVGCILEFHGPGAAGLPLPDRATIANMAPEFGAMAAMFAIDAQTIEYLRITGRSPAHIRTVEAYARAQGLWALGAEAQNAVEFDRRLSFDLSTVGRSLAGPKDPHQLVQLDPAPPELSQPAGAPPAPAPAAADDWPLPDSAIVIAAITSCTNTANPRNMIAAGLLARRAVALGLRRKPWVKTSLAPGSKVVERYLESAGLLEPLRALGFGIVGFGCTSCNGMSGPLPEAVARAITERRLKAVAVLSGNRNFNGRIHPLVTDAYLASPAMVIAYAIAGSMQADITHAPLGLTAAGGPITLADLWPSDAAIDAVLAEHVHSGHFSAVYTAMFQNDADGQSGAPAPLLYPWRESSTYIRRPPYWDRALTNPGLGGPLRVLALLGDHVTTDDLSPSGAILPESAAGRYLIAHGTEPAEFNSYGTRRGDHCVAMRATLANNRLHNEMAGGREGSFTRLQPDGAVLPLFEAAEIYMSRTQELIIVAGKNYGCGSSRDWAAKGIRLLGVRAVLCESFERIHRTNLVGMGVLPLEFAAGVSRKTLAIDGSETFTIQLPNGGPAPGSQTPVLIRRRDGSTTEIQARCRIDTSDEMQVFAAGGLLPLMASALAASAPQPVASTRELP